MKHADYVAAVRDRQLDRSQIRLLRGHLRSLASDCEDLADRLRDYNPNDNETIDEDTDAIGEAGQELVNLLARMWTGRK